MTNTSICVLRTCNLREGQDDQLHALGLVVNAIILWNTRYMGVALEALGEGGVAIDEADIARLSP